MPAKLRLHAAPATLVFLLLILALAVALTPSLARATFPGKSGRIAFNAFIERTESIAIYTAKPNGGDVRKLTSLAHTASALPDWSPDGRRIAFYRERFDVDRPVQIYVMNANGSGVTQLTRGPGFHGFPAWSPDAGSLAIAADWGDYQDLRGIWIIPASDPGGVTQQEARRLTTLPAGARGEDAEPQFSPDGSSIVFTRFKSERKSAIHRVGIDGTGLERLTPWRLNASDPDWSPNGQKIAFDSGDAGGRTGGGGNIYVMRADGSGRTKLTDHPQLRGGEPFDLANNPVWSPSGRRIMFTHFLPKGNKLVAMKPNGSGKHVVIGGRFGKRHFPNKVDWGTHP
jgi:Tol biopolymer transport system component